MAAAAPKLKLAGPFAAQPAPPSRQYSFTDFQVNNPTSPPPGDRLDGEFDRTNSAIADTLAWAGTSLNTDGTLKPHSVGRSQLYPGLFDHIGRDMASQAAKPLKAALAAAGEAAAGAVEAINSAVTAAQQNALAQDASKSAASDAQDAASSAASAAQSALEADASATDALNSANHADLAENTCIDYGVLTQAWAEHMPDTIPPNILATMDVTGDHWSSRWWANKAHLIVQEETAEAICDLQKYWLGAYASPPTHNTCGDPVVAGSMYFNMTSLVCQVYDGVNWRNITQLAAGQSNEYLYLPVTPTTVFTGADFHGNVLALDPVSAQIGVYLNGVRLLQDIDYSITSTSVTMLLGAVTAPNSVEVIALTDLSHRPPPIGVKVNTNLWVFDGVTRSFPLQNSLGDPIDPPGSEDCLVSLNGVIQEAGGDFTTAPGQITFATAPEADADKWMVVGVPIGAGATSVLPAANEGDQLVYVSGAWTAQRPRWIASSFVPGTMTASQYLLLQRLSKAVTFPANFGSYLGHTSEARGTANATGSTVITLQKAASATPGTFTSVGSITVAAGAMTGTFASVGGAAVSFAQGDTLALIAPATPDATFAGLAATLVGYET